MGGNGNANVYAVSANGQKMVQKRHSDVYRIETTIKHDINVSITPPFLQGYLGWKFANETARVYGA
jgi:hypothetical protein